MRVDGPRDVPYLRQELIEQWDKNIGFYNIRQVSENGDEYEDLGGGDWDARVLRLAQNYYVSGDMCDVLTAAESQLPDTTILDPLIMPSPCGLVVFEKRLTGIDATLGISPPSVDAILWGQVQIVDINGRIVADAIGICSYRAVDPSAMEDLDFQALLNHMEMLDDHTGLINASGESTWVALGRSDWVLNKPVSHRHLTLDSETQFASMLEDRRRMAALWLLMSDAKITDVDTTFGVRGERRRAEREGYAPPTVRIVNIAKRLARAGSSQSDPTGRHWSVRALISAHWRNQYYASCPQCVELSRACCNHRPKYINAHWAGPEDGPVSSTESVRVWK